MSYSTDSSKSTEQRVWVCSPTTNPNQFFPFDPDNARRCEKASIRNYKEMDRVFEAHREKVRIFGKYFNISGNPNTTVFRVGEHNTYFVAYDKDGDCEVATTIIPRIVDVNNIKNKVVIVKFEDGTVEKAILNKDDTFSLEQGISICITKKLLSIITDGRGSSTYNKLVEHGLKVYSDKEKNAKKKADEEKAAKTAEQKKIEKARKKKEMRKAAKREEQISIQAEAIRRAMASMQNTPKTAE